MIPAILGLGIHKIPSGYQPSLTNTIEIFGDREIEQNIPATRDNFSGIGLSIKNPNLLNTSDLILDLISQDGQIKRTSKLSGRNIPDGDFVVFNFDPILNSQGKQFIYTLKSADSLQGAPLEPFYTSEHVPNTTNFFENHEQGPGALAQVSFYKPQNFLTVWIIIYRNWFWKFFQDLPFAFFYIVLILACVVFLGNEIIKREIKQ